MKQLTQRVSDDTSGITGREWPREGAATMGITKAILTDRDLAELLRVSTRTLRRWRGEGKVPPPLGIADAKEPRWLAEEIEAWLRAGCPKPPGTEGWA